MAKSATNSLQLPKELTYRQGRDCLQRLRPLVTGHADSQVVVDASAVKVFDSAALAVLLMVALGALVHLVAVTLSGLTRVIVLTSSTNARQAIAL